MRPISVPHAHPVRSLAFSPNGRVLITGGGEQGTEKPSGMVGFWDVMRTNRGLVVQTKMHVFNKDSRWSILSVVFSSGEGVFAIAEGDGTAKLMDPLTGTVLGTFEGDKKRIVSVAFAPDGQTLAAGSEDAVYVWRLLDRERVTTLATGNGGSCLAFSADGNRLAVGGRDLHKTDGSSSVKLFDVRSGNDWQVAATLDVPPKVTVWSVDFSPNSRILATALSDATVTLWHPENGKVMHTLKTGPVYWAAFSPDGRLLATAGDQQVKLWDVATREVVCVLEGRGWLRVNCVAFSSDGKLLAAGSADRYARVWEVDAAVKAWKARSAAMN